MERLFIHSTGHGVGLEIHERPRVGRKEMTKLEAGMVITIEPGVYQEGFGGVRIDAAGRVLDRAGHPIAGLHAAGEVVGGLFYHNYPGGSGLIAGAVFGRRVGISAGQRALGR